MATRRSGGASTGGATAGATTAGALAGDERVPGAGGGGTGGGGGGSARGRGRSETSWTPRTSPRLQQGGGGGREGAEAQGRGALRPGSSSASKSVQGKSPVPSSSASARKLAAKGPLKDDDGATGGVAEEAMLTPPRLKREPSLAPPQRPSAPAGDSSEATDDADGSGLGGEPSGMRTPTNIMGENLQTLGLPGEIPMGMFFSPIRSPGGTGGAMGSPSNPISPFLQYCATLSPYTPQRNRLAPNAFNDFLNSQYRSPTPFGSAERMQLGLAGPLSIGGSGKSPKVEDFSLIGTITELNVEYKFARGESLRKKNDARRSNEKGKGKGGAKGGQVSSQVGKGVSSQVLDPTTGLTMEDGTGMGDDRLGATWKADSAENASVASPSGGLGMDGKGLSRRALAFDSPTMSDGLPFIGGTSTADEVASLGLGDHSSLFDKSAREISEKFWVGGSPLASGRGMMGGGKGGVGKRMLGKELQLGGVGGGNGTGTGSAKKSGGGSGKKKSPRDGAGDNGEGCKGCSCKRSKCLKLYCECFTNGRFCSGCGCVNCENTAENEELVNRTREVIKIRNPTAFQPKVLEVFSAEGMDAADGDTPRSMVARHKKGCSCKRSNCLKKYCECFQEGVNCGDHCKCEGCKNSSFGCGPGDGDAKQGIRLDTVKNKKLNRVMAQAASEVGRAAFQGAGASGSAQKRPRFEDQQLQLLSH